MRVILVFVLVAVALGMSEAKIYSRCELAKRLRALGADPKQLATWICIAFSESSYNTAALNVNTNGSKDFGIFQINNSYWCDRPASNPGCNVRCSKLQDDDIADDFKCAQQIYKEFSRMSYYKGDGFMAWYGYQYKCTNGRAASYLQGC